MNTTLDITLKSVWALCVAADLKLNQLNTFLTLPFLSCWKGTRSLPLRHNFAINELNEDSIINLVLFSSDIMKRQIENYFLTVLLISKLLKDLMDHLYDHRQ